MRRLLYSTFTLLLVSNLALANICNLSFKQVKEAALVEQVVDLQKVHHSFEGLQPYKYEVELAEKAGLSVEEVMGLTRNFHDDLITTGDTGIYRMGKELKYLPDSNLIKAYKYAMESMQPGKITADQLIQMRKYALELNYFKHGKKEVRVDFKFKGTEDNAYITDQIDDSVLQRLDDFGHEVVFHPRDNLPDDLPDFIKLKNDSPGVYVIKYPESQRLEKELDKLATKINELVEARAPPEYIASVAVQDILTLHPFADGNGRSARLYGQVLYKQLTGNTVIFPKLFHKEMSHHAGDLAKALVKNPPTGEAAYLRESAASFEEIMEHAVYVDGISPKVIGKNKPLRPLADVKFDDVKAYNVREGRKLFVKYANIDDSHKLINYEGDLFFGKGFRTMSEAHGHIKSFFSKGRKRVTLDNVDLDAHVESTADYRSSFIQTTKYPEVAVNFSHFNSSQKFGVVYIIDSKNVEKLDVNSYVKSLGRDPEFEDEAEVLLFGHLNPQRIKGAYITDKKNVIIDILVNPHYKTP